MTTLEKNQLDPAKKYRSPERLIDDGNLDSRAKKMLLTQWQKDLLLLMTASEENMPATRSGTAKAPSDSDNADLLQRVSNCLLKLESGREKTNLGQKAD